MAQQIAANDVRSTIDALYRSESRRVFATLVRLLGDFDAAEEALHNAFAAAVVQWPVEGIPQNPRAWLVSAGRFKAIDAGRRQARHHATLAHLAEANGAALRSSESSHADQPPSDEAVEDDRLRLIFTCCHPALSLEAQIALTLREVCGLKTEEIASAFLTTPTTLAQRIVRAKSKIRNAGIPFKTPSREDLSERLAAVLHVIYLVFNEGYAASSGQQLTRSDLSDEAIRLGRMLLELLPEPEVMGLLALMLLHEARRPARLRADGEFVLLEEQDRSLWDRELIAEGQQLLERSLRSKRFGGYTLQAAISAVHADALVASDTDWKQIAGLYDLLKRVDPSPIVHLNSAVAVAMRDGPQAGLPLVDAVLAQGELSDYYLAHAARADLCRRLGRYADARAAYELALELARTEPERRFLQRRLHEVAD